MIALFAAAVFLASALVFLLEPMIAKALLPTFGGAPQVWTAATVFFQAALLAGYAYAHVSTTRLGGRRGALVHVAVVAAALLALPIAVRGRDVLIGAPPALAVAGILVLSVGAPFVVVSATSPILQRWLSRVGHPRARDPYFLYAAGNAGSLLGLLAYPFVVEPSLRVGDQALLWSAGYVAFAVVAAAVATIVARKARDGDAVSSGSAAGTDVTDIGLDRPRRRRELHWLVRGFVPASLLLGVTSHLQTDIAAVPLLWVIPLAIYLLTFVLAFSGRPIIPPELVARVVPVGVVAVLLTLLFPSAIPIWLSMAIHDGTFFAIAMLAHGQLAADRPGPEHLTRFYLVLAVGGVLGGLFNAVVAPAVFNQVLEYPIVLVAALLLRPGWSFADRLGTMRDLGVALGALVVSLATLVAVQRLTAGAAPGALVVGAVAVASVLVARRPLRFAGVIAAVLVITFASGRAPIFIDRTFFGVHRVTDDGGRHVYLSGATIHGAELVGPNGGRTPLAYYHPTGPAGEVFQELESARRLHDVGLIGLGAGSLAAYGQAGQTFTFYEIDPVVIRIASDPALFTFVSQSPARIELIEGDGRLRIADAADASFDLIVLDAFSSDAVPAHLVTREAFDLYIRKLRPGGVILANVTNTYLDVRAVVAGGGQAAGLVGLWRGDGDVAAAPPGMKDASTWVVLARHLGDLGALTTDNRWAPLDRLDRTVLWTDDFSDILSVLRR